MRKIALGFIMMATLIFTSCTNPMDKPMNSEGFDKVKEEILNDKSYSPMKSEYIIDNLSKQLGFLEIGKAMGKAMGKDMDESKISTFREEIAELTIAFDSIHAAKIKISDNNKKLDGFIELIDARSITIDKYKGYLKLKVKFNNNFDKEILYAILNYKYVNKYDTEFFSNKIKLTDEIAGSFNDTLEFTVTAKYNKVANFIYKAPCASLYYDKPEDEVKNRKYMMQGMKVEIIGIIFKDKTELFYQDAEWKYLEN